jgi:nicotinate-nucleotide adenylyltransferase
VERVNKRPQIGIFGGSFDPPHLGHLILAAKAHQQLNLDQVYFVLTADPPHKLDRDLTPISHRLAMMELALEGQPDFQISRVEIDRPGPHFTLDSIKLFQGEIPDSDLIYLIGGDSLRDFPTWKKPGDIVDLVSKIGVMRRPFTELDLNSLTKEIPELERKLEFINTPLLEISSREIRERVATGGHFRNYLAPAVFDYIVKEKLYKS